MGDLTLASLPEEILRNIISRIARRALPTNRPPTEILPLAATSRWLRAAVARVVCTRMNWLSSAPKKSVPAWMRLAHAGASVDILSLSFPKGDDDDLVWFTQIAPTPRLEELDLSQVNVGSVDTLGSLLRTVRLSLTKLSVKVNDAKVVRAVSEAHLTCLKYLRASSLSAELYIMFCEMLQSMQNPTESALSEIYFDNVQSLPDSEVLHRRSFSSLCPNVTNFHVEGSEEVSLSVFFPLLEGLEQLRVLDIGDINADLSMMEALATRCPQIAEFHLTVSDDWYGPEGSNFDGDGLNFAWGGEGGGGASSMFSLLGAKLTRLYWTFRHTILHHHLAVLASSCCRLTHLDLTFFGGSEKVLPQICDASKNSLRSLSLNFCPPEPAPDVHNPEDEGVQWKSVVESILSISCLEELTIITYELPVEHWKTMLTHTGETLLTLRIAGGDVWNIDPVGRKPLKTFGDVSNKRWIDPSRTPMLDVINHVATHCRKLRIFLFAVPHGLGRNFVQLPPDSEYGKSVRRALKELETAAPDLDAEDIRRVVSDVLLAGPLSL